MNACWDDGLLRIELAALQEENFALDPIGFEDEELARLLAAQDAADGLTDEDAVPELSQTSTSIAGDVWILGNQMSFPFLVVACFGKFWEVLCRSPVLRCGLVLRVDAISFQSYNSEALGALEALLDKDVAAG